MPQSDLNTKPEVEILNLFLTATRDLWVHGNGKICMMNLEVAKLKMCVVLSLKSVNSIFGK